MQDYIRRYYGQLRYRREHLPGKHIQKSHGGGGGAFPMVFHGTSLNFVKSIRTIGLRRGPGWHERPPSVYFTENPKEAQTWGRLMAHRDKEFRYAVVEFEVPSGTEVIPDEIARNPKDLDFSTASRVEEDIPPENIRGIQIWQRRRGRPMEDDELVQHITEEAKRDNVRVGYAPFVIKEEKG